MAQHIVIYAKASQNLFPVIFQVKISFLQKPSHPCLIGLPPLVIAPALPHMERSDQNLQRGFQNSKRRRSFFLFPEMENEEGPEITEKIPSILPKGSALLRVLSLSPFRVLRFSLFRVPRFSRFQCVKDLFIKIGAAEKTASPVRISCYNSPLRGHPQINRQHRSAVLNVLHDRPTLRLPLLLLQPVRHAEGISQGLRERLQIIKGHKSIRTAKIPHIGKAYPVAGAAHPHDLLVGVRLPQVPKRRIKGACPRTFHSLFPGQSHNILQNPSGMIPQHKACAVFPIIKSLIFRTTDHLNPLRIQIDECEVFRVIAGRITGKGFVIHHYPIPLKILIVFQLPHNAGTALFISIISADHPEPSRVLRKSDTFLIQHKIFVLQGKGIIDSPGRLIFYRQQL